MGSVLTKLVNEKTRLISLAETENEKTVACYLAQALETGLQKFRLYLGGNQPAMLQFEAAKYLDPAYVAVQEFDFNHLCDQLSRFYQFKFYFSDPNCNADRQLLLAQLSDCFFGLRSGRYVIDDDSDAKSF